ncbi:MAG: YfcE family phosphodiesterase [Bacteroidota bacterium]
MKIGILSDTHDHVPRIKEAFELFEQRGAQIVLHSGDFCSPFMIPEMKAPKVFAVWGNNDGDIHLIQRKCHQHNIELLGGFGELELGGRKLALYHGTYAGVTQALVDSENYDVVVSGHTHTYICEQKGKTWHLNPGSVHGFGKNGSAMILNSSDMTVERLKLGASWD